MPDLQPVQQRVPFGTLRGNFCAHRDDVIGVLDAGRSRHERQPVNCIGRTDPGALE